MKTKIFIFQLYQQGNIGAHQIKQISGQPKSGFVNHIEAKHHLEMLFNKNEFPFRSRSNVNYAILEVYSHS